VSKCWKQENTNWKCLGSSSQDSAQSGSTGLSGGAPDCVRCARLARANSLLSGFHRQRTTIIQRTVRCTPDCPVRQRSAGPTLRDLRKTRGRANGWEGAPDCPVCTGQCPVRQRLQGCQRSASPQKERNPHRTVSGVHRTVRCARRQKARIAFPDCSQRLLAALGL
jgi:hypothetical protein